MPLYRVRTQWSGVPLVGPAVTNAYFNSATGTAQQAVTAWSAFLASSMTQVLSTVSYAVEPQVATIDAGAGALLAITNTTPGSGVGTASGDAAPPATQGRLDLNTTSIINNRLLKGEIFMPGVSELSNSSLGVPTAGYISTIGGAATTLVGVANADWVVWSRVHGVFAPVDQAIVWPRWAILKSRRD